MKDARKVNRERFVQWFAEQRDNRNARKELSKLANVSVSLINQAMTGKLPGEVSRTKLCRAMSISENELFPILAEQKEFVFR